MIKCSHRVHALNMYVHITHQCGTHKNLCMQMHSCVNLCMCMRERVCQTPAAGLKLKPYAERDSGLDQNENKRQKWTLKNWERRGEKHTWGEQEEEKCTVCLRREEWAIAFAAVLQLVSELLFHLDVRQTSPIGSLLSAVCLHVKEIGGNGGGKETSERNLKE